MMTNTSLSQPPTSLRVMLRRLKQRSPLFRSLVGALLGGWAWALLLGGLIVHGIIGKTPKSSHLALIAVFIRTRGRANDILSGLIGFFHPPYRLPPAHGVLGNLDGDALAAIERDLERDGYRVFKNCLSGEFCDRLLQKSLEAECLMMGDDVAVGEIVRGRYDRASPKVPKYLLTVDDTTDIAEVQELMSDPSLVQVAQNYLRSKPIFTGISLWWSPPVKKEPDANAAQQFHWDMERIRWLRFFIYLTDVTPGTGPHCFIAGSHRTHGIPGDMLEMGYVRQSDENIIQRYGRDHYREFTGTRGTIIAEDSRGFHKGGMPVDGDRLILAFELSNTTFGADKRHRIRNIRFGRFAEFARQFPRLYENFDFDKGLVG
jgi:hypothetical protein